MFQSVIDKIRSFIHTAGDTYRRYPEAISFSVSVMILLMVVQHLNGILPDPVEKWMIRIAMGLGLGVWFGLIRTSLSELRIWSRPQLKLIIYWILCVTLMIAFPLFWLERFEFQEISRYLGTNLSLILLVFSVPYFRPLKEHQAFSLYVLTRLAETALFAGILLIGMMAICGTIDFLFGLGLMQTIYLDLVLLTLGLFVPLYGLTHVPRPDQLDELKGLSPVFELLFIKILMPLLTIYATVLTSYFLKMLFTWKWPNGMVGNMVVWFAAVTCIVLYATGSLRDQNRWVGWFVRVMPIWIMPMLVMMFISAIIRIQAYGITVNRYWLLAIGIWVTITSLYYVLRKSVRNVAVPIMLAIAIAISISGPWGAYATAWRDQLGRLEQLLHAKQQIKNGMLQKVKSGTYNTGEMQQIRSSFQYLEQSHDWNDITWLPTNFDSQAFESYFGFNYYGSSYDPETIQYFSHRSDQAGSVNIAGYETMLWLDTYRGEQTYQRGDMNFSFYPSSKLLILQTGNNAKQTIQINEIAKQLHVQYRGKDTLLPDELSRSITSGEFEVKLIFRNIGGTENTQGNNITTNDLEFMALIRKNP